LILNNGILTTKNESWGNRSIVVITIAKWSYSKRLFMWVRLRNACHGSLNAQDDFNEDADATIPMPKFYCDTNSSIPKQCLGQNFEARF